jgi:hypothetical protein
VWSPVQHRATGVDDADARHLERAVARLHEIVVEGNKAGMKEIVIV